MTALRSSPPPAPVEQQRAKYLTPADYKKSFSKRLERVLSENGVTRRELRAVLDTNMRDVEEILEGKRRFGCDQILLLADRPERAWKRLAKEAWGELGLLSRPTTITGEA